MIPSVVMLMLLSYPLQAARQTADTPDEVLCFAASSTVNAVEAVAVEFENRTGVRVRISSAGSQTLARQIAQGAAADVFLSAGPEWIEFLRQADLLAAHDELLVNQLVVVVPRNTTLDIRTLEDLPAPEVTRLALGDPDTVPAGIYARTALERSGLWDRLRERVASFPNVRQALLFVERGEADAGVVYRTDALDRNVRIAVEIDPELARPTVIRALLRRDRTHPSSRAFYEFLSAEPAARIFARHGFLSGASPAADVGTHTTATRGWLTGEEWSATRLSLWVSLWAVGCSLPFAMALGYVLARRQFPGKWIVESLINLPLVVPPVVTGYLLLMLCGRQGPLGGPLERWFGIEIAFTWLGAALAAAVVSFPLMLRAIRLAFENVDPRLVQAARTLGAGRAAAFRTVTLPLARRGILVGVMLAFARSLGEFGATVMIASNIAGQTRTIPLAVYHTVEKSGVARAWGLVAISIALASAALMLSELLQRRRAGSAHP